MTAYSGDLQADVMPGHLFLGELDCLVTERFVDPLLEKEMTWHNVSLQIA